MSELAQVLFQNGYPTPLMLGRWLAKGGLQALSPNIRLTENGKATPLFNVLWANAFPAKSPLPDDALHDAEGKPTVSFHRVWR
jgi:hypothetical protein